MLLQCTDVRRYLVLVEFTVLVLLLPLALEGDNHKTNEDVHHEECDDDDVDEEEDGDERTVVVNRAAVLGVSIDGAVHQAERRGEN